MRRYLTEREKADIRERQNDYCAGCGGCIELEPVEYDHSTPVALGNDEKPDQALCIPCHKRKTKRDVKAIAKAKRLHRTFVLGEKRKTRPIPSRGFDRTWSRRMNGTVTRREAHHER